MTTALAPRLPTIHPTPSGMFTRPINIGRVIARIRTHTFCDEAEEFVTAYAELGERGSFLWQWVIEGLRLTTLPCVDPSLAAHVETTKLLGVMFDVMLDDVADARRDDAFLAQLLHIPFTPSLVDREAIAHDDVAYFDFTARLWETIQSRASQLPRYAELADLLEFDYRQLMNCMRYASILGHDPRRMNVREHDLYAPHNMHMMISGTLDLMASPDFDMSEIGRLRSVLWEGQMMGRIGNMVTTWPREILAGDLTSGVFAHALEEGLLLPDELHGFDPQVLGDQIRRAGIEGRLLSEWRGHRAKLVRVGDDLHSVDAGRYADGLDKLLHIHLASRGLK
ncbi:MAG: hypothetical protein ACI9MR_004930 [Myxococcota bacterium]|jgi:hypothetical protein